MTGINDRVDAKVWQCAMRINFYQDLILGTASKSPVLILKADLGQVCLFDNFGRIPKLSDPGPGSSWRFPILTAKSDIILPPCLLNQLHQAYKILEHVFVEYNYWQCIHGDPMWSCPQVGMCPLSTSSQFSVFSKRVAQSCCTSSDIRLSKFDAAVHQLCFFRVQYLFPYRPAPPRAGTTTPWLNIASDSDGQRWNLHSQPHENKKRQPFIHSNRWKGPLFSILILKAD